MEKGKLVEVLAQEMRTNTALRHRLGIEGAADAVSSEADGPLEAVVFQDKDGKNWALAVLEDETP